MDPMIEQEQFELTAIEQASPLWGKLMVYFEGRKRSLRAKNEGDLDPIQTAKVRGQLAELRALMTLNEEPLDITDR